ncbi:MAG: iron-sulfur cluster carrier protein ApbC [Gammaproteobacteria bacterium]|nr:iron-sulfur cluster carrier protein ApbC [Gammaproteobacteria bacterium]
MSGLSRSQVESALKNHVDRYLKTDFVSTKVLKSLEVEGNRVNVKLVLGFPGRGYVPELRDEIAGVVRSLDEGAEVTVEVEWKVTSHAVQKGVEHLKEVRNVIAVASGKGGVGKSTVAVNLALALATEGGRIGILDADIYGPSQPRMLGVSGQPDSKDGKSLEPMVSYGVQAMSIGFLIEEETPMIWRGPMVTQALEQLLKDTNWRDLDYLIIDLPPGTGDIQLTLAQKIPVSGAVIVTTPQDIALLDARKGLKMFEKVQVPVLGVIENMSTHVCSQCGHEEHIFGAGGGARMAEQHGVDLLGELPLSRAIREDADGGRPTVVKDPDSEIARRYRDIARRVAAKLSLQAKDYSQAFPKIVIQNT